MPQLQELRQGKEKSLGNKTKGKMRVLRNPGCPTARQRGWKGNSAQNSFVEGKKEDTDPVPLPWSTGVENILKYLEHHKIPLGNGSTLSFLRKGQNAPIIEMDLVWVRLCVSQTGFSHGFSAHPVFSRSCPQTDPPSKFTGMCSEPKKYVFPALHLRLGCFTGSLD